ncbi:protein of unknown function [Taphrina deformans PYCC 5710]|uniref:Uncharacterized protein n=1 Tax=Taphrina deformans (strain PYCC 5710 / ATCC 11124 / CBS 356.35 / IMI 108563 / JCM 9778 / NBRC 8474) TaxID=1097556 RepID=R4XF19_TAPDE|nr:protein of unknown function [Taphrina deformans PYCC 5710]|eukprot:CCG84462.1 protein of unknown function [Taphrina deformans PYCC 5710]
MPSMRNYLLRALFSILSTAFALSIEIFPESRAQMISETIGAGSPIDVELFVMSKCPDAWSAEHTFLQVIQSSRLKAKLDITLHFITNQSNDGCMHGALECRGNALLLTLQESQAVPMLPFLREYNADTAQIGIVPSLHLSDSLTHVHVPQETQDTLVTKYEQDGLDKVWKSGATAAIFNCIQSRRVRNNTMFNPLRLFSRSSIPSSTQSLTSASLSRAAHTYSRQDRGLYANTHKQFGNSISESHRKTARCWLPNVHTHTTYSKSLRRFLTLKMPASVWRTIQNKKYGGDVDAYLTSPSKAVQRGLGLRGQHLRREIKNSQVRREIETATREHAKARKRSSSGETEGVTTRVVDQATVEASRMEGVASGM